MRHMGDITKINGAEVPRVEVVIGGSPCQDLSVAGKRAGLAGERSGLFMEQIRVIKEMRKRDVEHGRTGTDVYPRFMVWENVPGALSSNRGEDFRAVLEETVRVADKNAAIPRYEGGSWRTSGVIMGDGFSVAWRVHDAQFWGVPQRRRRIALVADFGGLAAPEILFEREGVRGDPAESGETREGTSGCAARCAYPTIAHDLTYRFDGSTEPDKSRGANLIVENAGVYDARGNGDGKTVPTITGDHGNRITDYTAICIGNGQAHIASHITPDVCQTLNCMHDQMAIMAVDCRNGKENKINGTLQAKSTGGSSVNLQNICREGSVVRRLTPLECERLQGYPDGWTDIGDWTDSNGKLRKTSDSARYKALGNSIALPFWRWMLKKMIRYCREGTMASLFDGIGGFPLCWKSAGGVTLWASEIEEFQIAVTKYHFGEGDIDAEIH